MITAMLQERSDESDKVESEDVGMPMESSPRTSFTDHTESISNMELESTKTDFDDGPPYELANAYADAERQRHSKLMSDQV